MTDDSNVLGLTEGDKNDKNLELVRYLNRIIRNNSNIFDGMRKKILLTYKVTIALYIILFGLGVLLLLVPVISAFQGNMATYNSLLSGTLGITNLVVLFLFKPVEQIHNLMSEIGQLTIITNSYQEQEALRLLELNADDKKTIGEAAVHINNAAANSVSILEKYCEIQSS